MDWTQTRERLIACGVDAAKLPETWQWGIILRDANLDGADLARVLQDTERERDIAAEAAAAQRDLFPEADD